MSAPPHPGCWIVAPLWPHLLHFAHPTGVYRLVRPEVSHRTKPHALWIKLAIIALKAEIASPSAGYTAAGSHRSQNGISFVF
jgi:hypothetical protein